MGGSKLATWVHCPVGALGTQCTRELLGHYLNIVGCFRCLMWLYVDIAELISRPGNILCCNVFAGRGLHFIVCSDFLPPVEKSDAGRPPLISPLLVCCGVYSPSILVLDSVAVRRAAGEKFKMRC